MFTLDQAMKAQQALRGAANLPVEEFPIQAFIGMMSDEIQALREKGKTDDEITKIINSAAGTGILQSELTENYASPEDRRRE